MSTTFKDTKPTGGAYGSEGKLTVGKDVRAAGMIGGDYGALDAEVADQRSPMGVPDGPYTPNVAQTYPPLPNEAVDGEGAPIKQKMKKKAPGPRGPVLTPDEKMNLMQEKGVLEQFRTISTAELKWTLERERGPQTQLGWWKYIGLCGPMPGPKPDPNEEWPGKRRKHKIKTKKSKTKTVAPAEPEPEHVVEPAVLEFRKEAFQALSGGNAEGIDAEKADLYSQLLGYVPSEADKKKLGTNKLTETKFNEWLNSILHPEDKDQVGLAQVFKILDPADTGLVSEFAFKNILTSKSELLSVKQVEEVLNLTGTAAGGKVKYKDFIAELIQINRKLPPTSRFSAVGLDTSTLPEITVTEVTHF